MNDNTTFRIDSEFFRKCFIDFYKRNLDVKPLSDYISNGYRVVYENTKVLDKDYAIKHNCPMFLQATDIATPFINIDDISYVDEQDWIRYPKGRVEKGELLIEVKGKIEKVAIVPDDFPEKVLITGSLYKMKLNDKINKFYLVTYLTSKYGLAFKERYKSNLLISFLNKEDLYRMPIPLLSDILQLFIEKVYKNAIVLHNESLTKFADAESNLLKRVCLSNWKVNKKNTSEKSYSCAKKSDRLDAEYYLLKYDELFEHLAKYKTKRLGDIVSVTKSVEPGSEAYQNTGVPFVRVANLSKFGLLDTDIYLDKIEFASVVRPQKNTILLSKDGSVGIAYKIEEYSDIITSGAILHLEVIDEEVLPDYLTLVLNSIIVKMQAERDAGGSIIQHWKPSEIENVVIPILDKEVQIQITEKVQESFALRKESKRLLELAKTAVEVAIEQGEDKAMELLTQNM